VNNAQLTAERTLIDVVAARYRSCLAERQQSSVSSFMHLFRLRIGLPTRSCVCRAMVRPTTAIGENQDRKMLDVQMAITIMQGK